MPCRVFLLRFRFPSLYILSPAPSKLSTAVWLHCLPREAHTDCGGSRNTENQCASTPHTPLPSIAFVHFRGSYDGLHGGQKRTTKLFAKEGYDLVVGHGPHIAHPVGRVADTMVLWSLGNFVFNTPGRFKHKGTTGEAIVATAVLGPGGFERLELGCIQADNQVTKYRTRPCDDAERGRLLELLGPMASMEGELAVVPWGAKE